MGEYIPRAPVDEEARRRNENLPGMGGVFNTINLHVYHYAGNNPVKLKDPDGREIYLDGNSQEFSLAYINTCSYDQYKIGKNNRLEIDSTKINKNGSKTYSKEINEINDRPEIVRIFTSSRVELPSGFSVSANIFGEGMTIAPEGTGIANEWAVIVSGRSTSLRKDQSGENIRLNPWHVLIHELVGHAFAQIRGNNSANADELENIIRAELGLPLMEIRPHHTVKDAK
jgi:hypothetical protein